MSMCCCGRGAASNSAPAPSVAGGRARCGSEATALSPREAVQNWVFCPMGPAAALWGPLYKIQVLVQFRATPAVSRLLPRLRLGAARPCLLRVGTQQPLRGACRSCRLLSRRQRKPGGGHSPPCGVLHPLPGLYLSAADPAKIPSRCECCRADERVDRPKTAKICKTSCTKILQKSHSSADSAGIPHNRQIFGPNIPASVCFCQLFCPRTAARLVSVPRMFQACAAAMRPRARERSVTAPICLPIASLIPK